MDRLEKLVHGHFVQVKMSKQTREKHFKESVKRMNKERQEREAKRLKKMDTIDKLEDEGKIIIRPHTAETG